MKNTTRNDVVQWLMSEAGMLEDQAEEAIEKILDKATPSVRWEDFDCFRVLGSDIRWKGWNIRGNARFHSGWIITDSDGVEVYRLRPETVGEIPVRQLLGMLETKKSLGELTPEEWGRRNCFRKTKK